MRTADGPVFGAHCYVTYSPNERSTLSVSVTPDEQSGSGLVGFGTLAYALPTQAKPVSSTLISTGDQAQVDAATEIAQMLAAVMKRPVFVNASVAGNDIILLKSVKEFVTSL